MASSKREAAAVLHSSVKRDAKSFYTRERREQKSACTKYDKAWLYSIIMGGHTKNLHLVAIGPRVWPEKMGKKSPAGDQICGFFAVDIDVHSVYL